MRNHKGFTLVELIIIIAILGILAAVAIPRYIDLTQEAADGTLRGVLGALRSQNSLMFAERVVKGTTGEYTMGDIVTQMGQLGGVERQVIDDRTLLVTVGKNYSYTIELDQLPNPPTVQGKITCRGNPDW